MLGTSSARHGETKLELGGEKVVESMRYRQAEYLLSGKRRRLEYDKLVSVLRQMFRRGFSALADVRNYQQKS